MTTPAGGYRLPAEDGYPAPDDSNEASVARVLLSTLEAIITTFEQAGVDLPARKYPNVGGTAVDCEQLTVQLDQVYLGVPGGDPNAVQSCNGPRTCTLTVQLWRCAPSSGPKGQPPSVAALASAAIASAKDAWLLLDATKQIDVDASWGNNGVIAEVSALESAGSYQGLSMSLVLLVP